MTADRRAGGPEPEVHDRRRRSPTPSRSGRERDHLHSGFEAGGHGAQQSRESDPANASIWNGSHGPMPPVITRPQPSSRARTTSREPRTEGGAGEHHEEEDPVAAAREAEESERPAMAARTPRIATWRRSSCRVGPRARSRRRRERRLWPRRVGRHPRGRVREHLAGTQNGYRNARGADDDHELVHGPRAQLLDARRTRRGDGLDREERRKHP